MNEDERVQYLANIYCLVRIDGDIDRVEERLFEQIARDIGAGYFEMRTAIDRSGEEGFKIKFPQRCSDRIRNLEDMLLIAYSDKKMHEMEKKILCDYARQLGISDAQFKMIQQETQARFDEVKKSAGLM